MLKVVMKLDPRNIIYNIYSHFLWNQIKDKKPPHHVAFIMDGNRRWAESKRFAERSRGHEFGVKKLKEIVQWVWNANIEVLTIFAFSGENFSRSPEEVSTLMNLFRENFLELVKTPEIHQHKIRVKAIGRIESLPDDVQEAIFKAEEATKDYTNRLFQIAIGYAGRSEVVDAIKGIINAGIPADDVNEELVHKYLYTSGIKDPDLIIRTSGEERLSGFLIWQSAYSEFYFADVYFPSFRKIDLWRAIRTYQSRQRRYGK
jgi:tritrans,polycis-undecaprenyl-diphosphate synthase [geranylgeranyl-diphosphate specific]